MKGSEKPATVSRKLFQIASSNLNRDFLRRWWCEHYKLPPTDPRLGQYTMQELTVEYLEYAIVEEIIMHDGDGNPLEVEDDGGDIMLSTGESLDEDEARWANQKPIGELAAEYWAEQESEEDLLSQIKEEAESDE